MMIFFHLRFLKPGSIAFAFRGVYSFIVVFQAIVRFVFKVSLLFFRLWWWYFFFIRFPC